MHNESKLAETLPVTFPDYRTMPRKKNTVTIVDVAKEAGVSVSTVSRVLNDKDDVSEATFKHVSSVIDDLAYSSSMAARSMRSRKTGVIGLIMPDVEDPYSVLVMQGVNRAIVELDYDLLIYTNGDLGRSKSGVSEQKYISLLNNSVTDGAIVVTPVTTDYTSSSPLITVDPNVEGPEGPSVLSTNFKGAYEATEHLLSLGHRRIGYIEGRADLLSSRLRKDGYESALSDYGVSVEAQLISRGDFTPETGRECARHLLNLEEPPTAIFASNDQTAIGVYEAAKQAGITIPEDLSVAGFDNIPESMLYDLTTIDQFVADMGYRSARMLYELIQGEQLDILSEVIETELVIRGSTKPI